MAVVDRVLVGESLVGDGNEVAHIDLIMGPRGSAAEAGPKNCFGASLWFAALLKGSQSAPGRWNQIRNGPWARWPHNTPSFASI